MSNDICPYCKKKYNIINQVIYLRCKQIKNTLKCIHCTRCVHGWNASRRLASTQPSHLHNYIGIIDILCRCVRIYIYIGI